MKIICSKSELVNSINIVLKAIPAKTTMPILECIIIDATEGGISFTTNDMELGIKTLVKGDILNKGSIAINAKIFSDIIRKLPDNDVTIDTDETFTAIITCEKSKFSIAGKQGDDFPSLPVVERENALVLSQYTLKEVVRQTVFSISENESNKIMTGELFEIKDNILRVASLDGHRISIRKIELKDNYEDKKVIVPGKALNEISKIITGETDRDIRLYFTDRHIMFEFDDTIVLSRLIEGEYYKIDQMISSDYETKVVVNKKELLNCIDRATLLIKESDKKPIILAIAGDTIEMKVNTTLGSMNEEIDAIVEGNDLIIGFNPRFIMDCLRAIDEDEVILYMTNAKAPCFIKDIEESYIYLILPVSINNTSY